MHLIGINGFKRSGKGTVANIVAALYNDGDAVVKGVGFADKLKVLAARSLGYTDITEAECIELMDSFKETGLLWADDTGRDYAWAKTITGRQYLQNVGSQARKTFGDNFWIDMVLPNPILAAGWSPDPTQLVAERYPGVDCLCITDLRYPNEAARVKGLGGVVWEVQRPGLSSDGHDSEQPLPRTLVDKVVPNIGTLRDLEIEVERAMDWTLS